jgi:hypothetical protein
MTSFPKIPIYDVRQADRVYLIPKAPGRAPHFVFAGLNINQRRGEPPHFTARTFQRLPSFLRKYEYLAVDDLTDAYYAYKLRDCDVTYLCFRVADRWFAFNRMPMGYNRSAWVLWKHIFYNLPYEDTSWQGDDIQHWSATHATCHATQTRNRAILANMGHNFNTLKAKPPKTNHDLLGLHVDLFTKTICFDPKNAGAHALLLQCLLLTTAWTILDYQTVLGIAEWAYTAYKPARFCSQPIIDDLRDHLSALGMMRAGPEGALDDTNAVFQPSDQARNAVKGFVKLFELNTPMPIARSLPFPVSSTFTGYSDASTTAGGIYTDYLNINNLYTREGPAFGYRPPSTTCRNLTTTQRAAHTRTGTLDGSENLKLSL